MSEIKSLMDYPEVSFIDNMTLTEIQKFYLDAMQEKYLELTGEELKMNNADPVHLIAYADCLLLYQIAQYADRAGKMSLLKYSYGHYLENIGALKGIKRVQGVAAKTILQFVLSKKCGNVTVIPVGTRVTAGDGIFFSTVDNLEIQPNEWIGEVGAVCKEVGSKGNGYIPGELNLLVDPVAYVKTVENKTKSEGGTDEETDDNFAERIFLAPSSWSTAGPDNAYLYWIKTFNPDICDAKIESKIPGTVNICFVMEGGKLPSDEIIVELEKYLQDENIRPLSDNVVIKLPDIQEYNVDISYYINASDRMKVAVIQEQVKEAVKEYTLWQCEKLGRDINPDQLRKLLLLSGVKRVEVRSPGFIKIPNSSVAVLQGTSVLYGGLEDD